MSCVCFCLCVFLISRTNNYRRGMCGMGNEVTQSAYWVPAADSGESARQPDAPHPAEHCQAQISHSSHHSCSASKLHCSISVQWLEMFRNSRYRNIRYGAATATPSSCSLMGVFRRKCCSLPLHHGKHIDESIVSTRR